MASVASSPGASTRPQTRLARWAGGAIVSRGRRILYDKARSARKRTQSDIFCQHGLLAQLPARPPQSAVKCNLVRLNALSLGSGAFNPPIVAFSLSGDLFVLPSIYSRTYTEGSFSHRARLCAEEHEVVFISCQSCFPSKLILIYIPVRSAGGGLTRNFVTEAGE